MIEASVFFAVAVAGVALAAGFYLLAPRAAMSAAAAPARPRRQTPRDRRAETPGDEAEAAPIQRLLRSFHEWVDGQEDSVPLWPAFDQFVREALAECVGAARVRCFHVHPESDALETLAQSSQPGRADRPALRGTLLGHVATTGRPYLEGDASHGALVDELAGADEDRWSWVAPIREDGAAIGLVAARFTDSARPATAQVRAFGSLIELAWRYVSCRERLLTARRTDPASGVLRRDGFFSIARRALGESYHANEPVVVGVLSIEGMRRLDDAGQWGTRDVVIERLGELVRQRVRSDDIVGRFSDDRFVVLLRRLDSPLAELIFSKLILTAKERIPELAAKSPVVLRAGLVGSGLARRELDDLLVEAMEMLDRARHAGLLIMTDLTRVVSLEVGT